MTNLETEVEAAMCSQSVFILVLTVETGKSDLFSTHSSLEAAQALGFALVYKGMAECFKVLDTVLDDAELLPLLECDPL
jgi:hypothetical protein